MLIDSTQVLALAEGVVSPSDETGQALANTEPLPFPPELIEQSVSNPQQKMAYMQHLTSQLTQTTDEQLKVLLSTIQLALFSADLSAFGNELEGAYRQAWETIAALVETNTV